MTKTLDGYLGIQPKKKKEPEKVIPSVTLDQFEENDWTFKTSDTQELTHAIFNEYPARMIPQIARKLINLYYPKYDDPKQKKPLLDPFAGSGTSCVEALIQNIDSIAFDLNPLANLIEKAKTAIIPPPELQSIFKKIMRIIKQNRDKSFPEYMPKELNLDFWYKEEVRRDLSIISFAIETVLPKDKLSDSPNAENIRNLLLICLCKTARYSSYQRRGEHKTYRMEIEKIREFDKEVDAIEDFTQIFRVFSQGSALLYDIYADKNYTAKCRPTLGNSMVLEGVMNNSIDLIVTSPPYGDSHTTVAYGQFSKFALEWLQLNHEQIINVDYELLGGEGKDIGVADSPLLFQVCKKIILEEIKQQNALLETIALELSSTIDASKVQQKKDETQDPENLNLNFEDFTKKLKKISSQMDNVSQYLQKLPDLSDFDSLLNLKNNYYDSVKEIKGNLCTALKNARNLDLHFKTKFKVYDERLPSVLSFFADFLVVFKRLFQVLDFDRKCCIVIGNRTVKRVKIPTDEIIIELGKSIGFEHVTTFYRDIPNKRMPKKNSPTNVPGDKITTIEQESIIILNKPLTH